VIVAPERRRRPKEPRGSQPAPGAESCPFCPGREADTPVELLRIPSPVGSGWSVRVIPNKFAALSPDEPPRERLQGPLFREVAAAGHHEVIVEGPQHGQRMADMSDLQVADALEAYHSRYLALRADPRVAYVIVFKNSGARAGASLTHPHSQHVATPMAPHGLQRRYARAREHHEATGHCLYCDLVEAELETRVRVVLATELFAVYCPFASGVPYETWIAPRRHQPSFGTTSRQERVHLARILRRTLGALDRALDRPDFNYVLHTAPVADEARPYYLWHLQILPRIATLAGFELGSGIPINSVTPEEAAGQLRTALPDEATGHPPRAADAT
jgi:UDPglucose--hexose-1-phosphate uridylyltransferase